MAGLRVLIFENRDRQGDNEPSHYLMFGEAEQRSSTPAAGHQTDQALRERAEQWSPQARDQHIADLAARFQPDSEPPF
jgi:hypothetical protein